MSYAGYLGDRSSSEGARSIHVVSRGRMRASGFHHRHSPSLPTTSSDVMLVCSSFAEFRFQAAASDRKACRSLEAVAHDFI